MTFTQLEIFVLVADLGGFTAAAERLGISQSAVSHALKQLEGEWGVTLLSRSKAGIEVTEVGRNLLARAREILGISEAIAQEVAAVRGLMRAEIELLVNQETLSAILAESSEEVRAMSSVLDG